jgi:signal peptidase I
LFESATLGIGYFLIIFNRKRRALHDFAAHTIVVRSGPEFNHELLIAILILIPSCFFSDNLFFPVMTRYLEGFTLPTGSLKPTVIPGDMILVDKYSPLEPPPERGDMIVFQYPADHQKIYMKRCIATGGQTVEIRNGKVSIDGKPEGVLKKIKEVSDRIKHVENTKSLHVKNSSNVPDYMLNKLLPETMEITEPRTLLIYKVTTADARTYLIQHIKRHNKLMQSDFGPVVVPHNHYFVLGDNRGISADSRHWGCVPGENIIGRPGFIYFSWDKEQKRIRWSRIFKDIR